MLARYGALPGGQPAYSPLIGDAICAAIAAGATFSHACQEAGVPAQVAWNWRRGANGEEWRAKVARAREDAAHRMADELVMIADDGRNDWVDKQTASGDSIRIVDHEHIQRSRLRVDTRFRLMAKFAPRDYGDKIEVAATVSPIARLEAMTDEQRLQEAYLLMDQVREALAAAREAGMTIDGEATDISDATGETE